MGKAIVEVLHVLLLVISGRFDLVDSGRRQRGVRSLDEAHRVAGGARGRRHPAAGTARCVARRPTGARPRDDEVPRRGRRRRPQRRRRRHPRRADDPLVRSLLVHRRRVVEPSPLAGPSRQLRDGGGVVAMRGGSSAPAAVPPPQPGVLVQHGPVRRTYDRPD